MGLATSDVKAAAEILAAGRLCAIPTETVYGLAADASNPAAVASVFEAKGRPSDHPLIVHVADVADIDHWITHLPEWAAVLADTYMPGPLTLVGPRTSAASDAITGGQDTVAVRVPSHALAHDLLVELRERGVMGLVAPSANTFGHVSPTTTDHVERDLGEYLRAHGGRILDGGPCHVGVESTIVLTTGPTPVLLRPGAISREMIAATTDLPVAAPTSTAPRVSGSLDSHYAPRARVHAHNAGDETGLANATGGLFALACVPDIDGVMRLGAPVDAESFARGLYAALRHADDLGIADVHVVIPEDGTGISEALRDRVSRAAAPR